MDTYLWDLLHVRGEEILRAEPSVMLAVVRRCLSIKAQYVAFDQRDSGLRRHLNLGHTFGHAMEGACETLEHGEAIALGLLAATRLSISLGMASKGLDRELEALLCSLNLPTTVSGRPSRDALALMEADKKHGHEVRTFIVPTGVGNCRIISDPPPDLVIEALESLIE